MLRLKQYRSSVLCPAPLLLTKKEAAEEWYEPVVSDRLVQTPLRNLRTIRGVPVNNLTYDKLATTPIVGDGWSGIEFVQPESLALLTPYHIGAPLGNAYICPLYYEQSSEHIQVKPKHIEGNYYSIPRGFRRMSFSHSVEDYRIEPYHGVLWIAGERVPDDFYVTLHTSDCMLIQSDTIIYNQNKTVGRVRILNQLLDARRQTKSDLDPISAIDTAHYDGFWIPEHSSVLLRVSAPHSTELEDKIKRATRQSLPLGTEIDIRYEETP